MYDLKKPTLVLNFHAPSRLVFILHEFNVSNVFWWARPVALLCIVMNIRHIHKFFWVISSTSKSNTGGGVRS